MKVDYHLRKRIGERINGTFTKKEGKFMRIVKLYEPND
jgi:hypothetical protein